MLGSASTPSTSTISASRISGGSPWPPGIPANGSNPARPAATGTRSPRCGRARGPRSAHRCRRAPGSLAPYLSKADAWRRDIALVASGSRTSTRAIQYPFGIIFLPGGTAWRRVISARIACAAAARIRRGDDRAGDDEMAGAGADRVAGRHHPLLVASVAARRPDAGRDHGQVGADDLAHGGRFARPSRRCRPCRRPAPVRRGAAPACAGHIRSPRRSVLLVHRGEHGDAEQAEVASRARPRPPPSSPWDRRATVSMVMPILTMFSTPLATVLSMSSSFMSRKIFGAARRPARGRSRARRRRRAGSRSCRRRRCRRGRRTALRPRRRVGTSRPTISRSLHDWLPPLIGSTLAVDSMAGVLDQRPA